MPTRRASATAIRLIASTDRPPTTSVAIRTIVAIRSSACENACASTCNRRSRSRSCCR
ncbi:hypothetical protein NMB32_12330 [Stenotrophomonas sp. CD2]|nr:hypothetical protein NMB32_12330 [Stenotrophomonas sp. CD2]